jgi:hypothetical protein
MTKPYLDPSRIRRYTKRFSHALYYDARKLWQYYGRGNDVGAAVWQHAQHLKRDGIVVIPNYFPRDKCAELAARIERLVPPVPPRTQPIGERQPYTISEYSRNAHLASGSVVEWRQYDMEEEVNDKGVICIYHIAKEFPELESMRHDPFVSGIVRSACNEALPSRAFKGYINDSVIGTRGYHVDNPGWLEFKAFLFLTDVNELSDGAHSYVRQTHLFSVLKYTNYLRNFLDPKGKGSDMKVIPERLRTNVLCPAGTLVIADVNGFHCGLPQGAGKKRVVLVNCFDHSKYT